MHQVKDQNLGLGLSSVNDITHFLGGHAMLI